MTDILEFIKKIRKLRNETDKSITVILYSNENLEPWFPLYLEYYFARCRYQVEIQRRSLSEYYNRENADFRIIWTGEEDTQEICEAGADPEDYLILPKQERTYEEAARDAVRWYRRRRERRKKCLILDLDGVVWEGILSEGKVRLGESDSCFSKLRETAIHLAKHGVILSLCSKNNFDEVKAVFDSRKELKDLNEYIVYWGCSFDAKSRTLGHMFEEIGIDPADAVFVDDSPEEQLEVKLSYPQIICLSFPNECIDEVLDDLFLPDESDINRDNELRIQTYRDNTERRKLEKRSVTREEYLKQLHTELVIREASPEEYERISDLSRRVNRCTNGIRYRKEQLDRLPDGYRLYVVYAKDVFRELGLIGAVGMKNQQMDLFCLSCRILGRDAEDHIMEQFRKNVLSFRWEDTGKNSWLKEKMERGLLDR